MTHDWPELILPLLTGTALGAFFFGGLWWTIRHALASRTPALWFLGSLIVRTAVTLSGFYFISAGHWERILSCLVGFVAARFFFIRFQQPKPTQSSAHKTPEPCD